MTATSQHLDYRGGDAGSHVANLGGRVRESARSLERELCAELRRQAQPGGPASSAHQEEADGIAVRPGTGKALLAFSLFAFVAVMLALLATRLVGNELVRGGHPGNDATRQIVIGDEVLRVPGNLIRFAGQRHAVSLERLDLYMRWPDLTGYSEADSEAFNRARGDSSIVFVTVEPRRMSLDMSGRIAPLYSKFFEGAEMNAGFGLKRRRLSDKAGFLDEDLYYEADAAYPFAARCVRGEARFASPYCLRDIHVGSDLTVTYRFHLSLISSWAELDRAIRARVQAMLED